MYLYYDSHLSQDKRKRLMENEQIKNYSEQQFNLKIYNQKVKDYKEKYKYLNEHKHFIMNVTLDWLDQIKKNSRGFRKIIKIVLIIYLTLYGTIKLLTISENNNICPIYINKEVKNYSETIISKNDYNIYIEKKIINDDCNNCVTNEKYNYNFKIIDNKVIIAQLFKKLGIWVSWKLLKKP